MQMQNAHGVYLSLEEEEEEEEEEGFPFRQEVDQMDLDQIFLGPNYDLPQ